MTKHTEQDKKILAEMPQLTISLDGISIHQLADRLNLSLVVTRKLISSLTEYKAALTEQAEALRVIVER